MDPLKIVATVVAKPECKDAVLRALCEVTDATRTEAGNISYTLHADVSNPLKFTILEVWQSQAAIDLHNEAPHFQAFKEALDGKIDSLAIDVLQEIY